MATLTEFCTLDVELDFTPIGKVGTGMRVDIPFTGTASSEHWEGERPVAGVDYVTIGADGVQQLDIRGRIGTGKDTVAYRAIGRGTNDSGPQELLVFETANEQFAHLNSAIAVAFGSLEGTRLRLTVSLLSA